MCKCMGTDPPARNSGAAEGAYAAGPAATAALGLPDVKRRDAVALIWVTRLLSVSQGLQDEGGGLDECVRVLGVVQKQTWQDGSILSAPHPHLSIHWEFAKGRVERARQVG